LHFRLLHDAHNLWPEFIEAHFGGNDSTSLKGTTFSQTMYAIEVAIAGQGIVLANGVFVVSDLKERRLVRVFDRSLRGASDFYLVWPRYRETRYRETPALKLAIAWMLKAAAQNS
jgi:LysR family glycine cleavage system transcriptional activator